MSDQRRQRIRGYCALCKSRCGCVSIVEDGRLIAVEPDPSHPTGKSLCAKGLAAPAIVHSKDRLLHPMKRTRPKGDADPGWQRISWDEALALTADRMRRIAEEGGPEAVAFAATSPSTTAMSDHIAWVRRLAYAFGSPNILFSTEICNWHKDEAAVFTYGAHTGTPDFARAGCIVLWGHNPSTAWLASATAVVEAKARGAKLIVVDPRRAGLANKADQWLRVRPGTDGALALGIAGVMIENRWFDPAFVRRWTNGPFLVRADNGRFLRAADLDPGGHEAAYVAGREADGALCICEPGARDYADATRAAALTGSFEIRTLDGEVRCEPAFQHYARLCAEYPPEVVERITGVPAAQVVDAARLIWASRPTAYYAWSGVGQHTNATQTNRAIAVLHALTGDHDAPGGNLALEAVPSNDVAGRGLIGAGQRAKALGLSDRPLGPAKDLWVTAQDFRRAVLDGEPYAVRGLVAFGSNHLLSQANTAAMLDALKALEFHVHLDLFMSPSAALADLVLPVTSPWEHEALRLGFEVSPEGQALVQLRQRVIDPVGEARSDSRIVFELAERLGLGSDFFGGSLEAGHAYMLEPSSIRLEDLRTRPEGISLGGAHHYRKYTGRGFATPSRRVEVYAELLLEHGQSPLPVFVEPAVSPVSRPDLAVAYPLVLTSAKPPIYCQSQHRGIAKLRRLQPDPIVEIHPSAAAARSIEDRQWVRIATPQGAVRARAKLNRWLDPRVVCAQHGWWQACAELGRDGFEPIGPESANYNLLIGDDLADPISGSVPLRSYLCQIAPIA